MQKSLPDAQRRALSGRDAELRRMYHATWEDTELFPVYRIFSEEELLSLRDQFGWLGAAEKSFEFWDNEEDAAFDNL